MPGPAISEVTRLCRESQERSDVRRLPSPNPWPEHGERAQVFLGSIVTTALLFVIVACAWAAA